MPRGNGASLRRDLIISVKIIRIDVVGLIDDRLYFYDRIGVNDEAMI